MVKRTRDKRKAFFLSEKEKARADLIKAETGAKDYEIYNLGLDRFAPDKDNPLHMMFKFDKRTYRKIRCHNCGRRFETSKGKGAAQCPACGQSVPEPEEGETKVKTGVTRGKSKGKKIKPPEDRFKFGAKDDLVEEEYQGNVERITESQRAMLFFNIPQDVWAALSEEEKLSYLSRLPPKKVRAGGEELSDRDSFETSHLRNTSREDFAKDQLRRKTKKLEERNREYREDRER